MRKIAATLFFLFGLLSIIRSQTVDSIKVEQAGELIKVHYKILNSNASQVFRVSVYCSINGGLQSVIKSLSGDFGDNVIGGRSDYMVLWDVLKDVDEVKSVDFSVRAELMKDFSVKDKSETKALSDRKLHAFVVAGGPGSKFGGRVGYMGSWGVSVMYLNGKEDPLNIVLGGSSQINVFSAGLDLTKRIVNAKNFNMHFLAGINGSKLLIKPKNTHTSDYYAVCYGVELGWIISIKRLAFSYCINFFPDQMGGLISGDRGFRHNFGLGYRF